MPELPEVETVARLVRPRLIGRRILRSEVSWARSVGPLTPRSFAREVRGARITSVRRRGKWIVCELARAREPAGALLVHLRMSGRLHVDGGTAPERPWTRVRLALDDGCELRFVDVRKFGRVLWVERPAALLRGLGCEPLGKRFTADWLYRGLRRRRRRLKPLLLDQAFVAGLGNIYVDESLHLARLHPLASSHGIRRARAAALVDAIRLTLRQAIAREGSSFDPFYRTPEGNPGRYQERLRVYGRAGQPCPACGRRIVRTVVAQRGTHLCTRCQRPPR